MVGLFAGPGLVVVVIGDELVGGGGAEEFGGDGEGADQAIRAERGRAVGEYAHPTWLFLDDPFFGWARMWGWVMGMGVF